MRQRAAHTIAPVLEPLEHFRDLRVVDRPSFAVAEQVLADAQAPDGDDWAMVWTVEDLMSERVEEVSTGWFSKAERQVFALDPFAGRGADTGATRTERMVILPETPYQAWAEMNPPGFRAVRKFVVGAGDRIMPA